MLTIIACIYILSGFLLLILAICNDEELVSEVPLVVTSLLVLFWPIVIVVLVVVALTISIGNKAVLLANKIKRRKE